MNYTLATKDILNSFRKWRIWYSMASYGIKAKYQRTKLGPIWIVLTNLIFVAGISVVWSIIRQIDMAEVLPRFFAGFITWQFMSSFVLDGVDIYSGVNKRYILNLPMEKFIFSLQMSVTNIFIYAHNLLGFILIVSFLGINPFTYLFHYIFAFVLTTVAGTCSGVILGIICARFRDVSPLIKSIMSLGMLVTPVLWDASTFGEKYYYVYLNPFAIFLDLLRNPMIGNPIGELELMLGCGVTLFIVIFSFFLFVRFRNRIVYWV
jgi:ABC-type polysaccharide/polyol phosphate export permease